MSFKSEIVVNSRMFKLKNVNVHLEDTGTGNRPVVMIHGWPLSGRSFKEQISALSSAGFRVITYDRRGFGESDKPATGYDYDTFADDLSGLLEGLNLHNVTLIGFSIGRGEVARYIAKYGEQRLQSVVFASSVTPMMLKSENNPNGPLEETKAQTMSQQLIADSDAFYDQFTKDFFSAHADGTILVSEAQRQEALSLCKQADTDAALQAMESFAHTDFRDDLKKVTVPTLVIHGDCDGVVPFEGTGDLTHRAIPQSELQVIHGGPHGINVSHADEFNAVVIDFLDKN